MGNIFVKYAEIGAAAMPPILNATTSHQLICVIPKNKINDSDVANVTKNSLADTVPIA